MSEILENEVTVIEQNAVSTEQKNEITINSGIFDLPDPIEVARRAAQTKKMMAAVCSVVSPQNITDFGGRPYFDHLASKRIANLFGLIIRQEEKNGQINYRKEVLDEATNHYIVKITGRVWHSKNPENYEIYEGSADSFDDWFRQWQIVEEREENAASENTGSEQSGENEEEQEDSSRAAGEIHPTYTIQKGDTITKISIKTYGSTEKVREICELNNLSVNDLIYPGQKILLP